MSDLYLDLMIEKIAESITDAIQQLLENKHLYQNLDVNYPDLSELIEEYVRPKLIGFNLTKAHEVQMDVQYYLSEFEDWRIIDPSKPIRPRPFVNSDGGFNIEVQQIAQRIPQKVF